MDKISITINGKTFEAEGKDLFEIIDNFLNDTDNEEQYNDIPGQYNDYMEYLSLEDFNPAKCTTKEQLNDLQKKLNNRLLWIKKYPKADLGYVKQHLNNMKADINTLKNKLAYINGAYDAVLHYIDTINK